jgi:hypothetical protein
LSDLEKTVAKAFKLRGKSRLTRTELTFALAYELKWFTPDECKEVLDAAFKEGLLKEAGDKLAPTFNVKAVDVPKDFVPSRGVLNVKSLLDRLLDMLAAAGIDYKAALEMVESKRKEYGGLITPEAAALIIAREKKLDVEPYVDEAYGRLLEKRE